MTDFTAEIDTSATPSPGTPAKRKFPWLLVTAGAVVLLGGIAMMFSPKSNAGLYDGTNKDAYEVARTSGSRLTPAQVDAMIDGMADRDHVVHAYAKALAISCMRERGRATDPAYCVEFADVEKKAYEIEH